MSDFYMMSASIMKMYHRKLPPKIISYRDYQKFSNENLLDSAEEVFSSNNNSIESRWIDFFLNT